MCVPLRGVEVVSGQERGETGKPIGFPEGVVDIVYEVRVALWP